MKLGAPLCLAACLAAAFLCPAACARKDAAGTPSPDAPGANTDLYELIAGPRGPSLQPLSPSELRPSPSLAPWPEALAVLALDALDDRIAVAVNRGGLGFLGRGPDGLEWDCPADPAFTERSLISAWAAEGRFWCFLAENRAFSPEADDERALPALPSLLLSRAPGEASYRRHPLPWEEDAGGAWLSRYLAPCPDGFFLVQALRAAGREAEWRYLRTRLDGSESAELSWSAYLSAFDPLPAEAVHPRVRSLCDPEEALGRYALMEGFPGSAAAVLLSLRLSGGVQASSYLRGSPESPWTATISAWAAENGALAVLHPGGGLAVAENADSAEDRLSLPALPPTFDYRGVAGAGGLWAAAWAEEVFPGTGRAGLALSGEGSDRGVGGR